MFDMFRSFKKQQPPAASAALPPPVQAASPALQQLADACAQGDAQAMLALSEYLTDPAKSPIVTPAYLQKGADMWLLRAAIYGSAQAQDRLRQELDRRPGLLRNSLLRWEFFIPERMHYWHEGCYPGRLLNAMGLLAFQPQESYLLAGLDGSRAFLVWQEAGYEAPDEDGFGAENYYDMFYLDEFFQPFPGVPVVTDVTTRDIRQLASKARFDAMTDAMRAAAGQREKRPLWTDLEEMKKKG